MVSQTAYAPDEGGMKPPEGGRSAAAIYVAVIPESMIAYSIKESVFVGSSPGTWLFEIEYRSGPSLQAEERVYTLPETDVFRDTGDIRSITVSAMHY
jgi:hypothetical protein